MDYWSVYVCESDTSAGRLNVPFAVTSHKCWTKPKDTPVEDFLLTFFCSPCEVSRKMHLVRSSYEHVMHCALVYAHVSLRRIKLCANTSYCLFHSHAQVQKYRWGSPLQWWHQHQKLGEGRNCHLYVEIVYFLNSSGFFFLGGGVCCH